MNSFHQQRKFTTLMGVLDEQTLDVKLNHPQYSMYTAATGGASSQLIVSS